MDDIIENIITPLVTANLDIICPKMFIKGETRECFGFRLHAD